jgi:tetratricopeptide (TPR) repeat protein
LKFRYSYILLLVLLSDVAHAETSSQTKAEPLSDAAYESLFNAVFDNPSDLQLNFELISAQLSRGNKKGAVGSLERVLMIDPDSYLAKILLAEIKMSLGNFSETTPILNEILNDPNAPEAFKTKAAELMKDADKNLRNYRFFGNVEIGMGKIGNLRGASTNNLVQYYNDYILTSGTSKKPESYYYDQLLAGIEYKLAAQTPQTINLVAFNNRRIYTHDDANIYDMNSKGLNLGYQYNGAHMLNLSATYMAMDLHQENFLTYSAIDGAAIEPINEWLAFKVTGGVAYMDYQNYSTIADNTINTGVMKQYSFAPIIMTPFDIQITPSLKEVYKEARVDYRQSESHEAAINITYKKSFGTITLNQLHRNTYYDGAETIYADYKRHDKENMTSMNVLLNLGFFIPIENKMLNNTKIVLEGSNSKTKSNILNFNKENYEIKTGLRYEF